MKVFVSYRLIAILFLLLLTAGCVSMPNELPMANIQTPVSYQAKKLPLNVGVFISDENYTAKATTRPAIPVPFGQILKKRSLDVFPNFFDEVTLTRIPSNLPNMDAIIIPSVIDVQFRQVDTTGWDFWTSSRADAQITVKVIMTDLKNSPIGEKTIKSPLITGEKIRVIDYGKPEHLSEIGRVSSEGVSAALQEAARELVMSEDVRNYASGRSKTKVTAAKPSQEASPIIKSDIDEFPTLKVRQNKNAYAIVIGIEQYRQKLPKAEFAVSDAKLVSEYLFKVMGYPEQNIVTLTNEHASKGDFEKYFEKWLSNNVEKDSTVFVYYSGHGAPNPKTSDAYLVPYDGDPSFIDQTGYSLKRMYDALGKLPAKEIIVALDSCFSGAGGRSVLAKGARPLVMDLQSNLVLSKNMTVLSASSGDQISSTYDEKGHGLFTYFLLKGIKNEDVVKKDGALDINELHAYIKPQVERIARKQYNNEQTPQLIGAKKN